jgi:hypothetical protein
MMLDFADRLSENTQNFTKTRPVGAELFRADRRTDGRTDVTKPIIYQVLHWTFSEFQMIIN